MKFFFDHNMPPSFAVAFSALMKSDGHDFVALRDRFPPDTPDVEWISTLGKEGGWVVVTRDLKIKTRPTEREAWRKAKLKALFLAPGWQTFPITDQAGRLLRFWPDIISTLEKFDAGTILRLKLKGKMEPYSF